MSLAEELRKLQAGWREDKPYRDGQYWEGVRDAAKELDPLIALAEAQEKELEVMRDSIPSDVVFELCELRDELAALKESKKPTYCLGLETVRKVAKEGQLETGEVDFVAADSLFHEEVFTDADLREVAEMAIQVTLAYPTADSLLSAWRERKAKSAK